MTEQKLQFALEKVGFVDHLCLRIYMRNPNTGRVAVAEPLTMREIEPHDFAPVTAHMPYASAQQLMDELWLCGIRPAEGQGSAGSLAATERHLKDMQAIAMGLLKQHGVDR